MLLKTFTYTESCLSVRPSYLRPRDRSAGNYFNSSNLDHSKIHTARQFCDFQCLVFLFRQSSMVEPVRV